MTDLDRVRALLEKARKLAREADERLMSREGGDFVLLLGAVLEECANTIDSQACELEAARAVVVAARGMGSYVCDEPDMSLVESARIVSLRSALARYDDATRAEVSR